MPKIEILVGPIACGKSTYARQRAAEGALIVSHDDLTAMLHGEYRYEVDLRHVYREMEESLVYVATLHGKDVVVDRTHLTRESRSRWLTWVSSRAETRGIEVVAVEFPVESIQVHSWRRYMDDPRGRTIESWVAVATHHAAQAAAEPLGDDEGFDRVVRVPAQAAAPRMTLTDQFVACYATDDDLKGWGVHILFASGHLPVGVDRADPRVVRVVERCRAMIVD